jgi:VWFA-related protein
MRKNLARLILILVGAFVGLGGLAGTAHLSAQSKVPVYQVVVDQDPVSVDVTVTDARGKAVIDLTDADFSVYEDGQLQKIARLKPIGVPFSILLLVDRSPKRATNVASDVLLKSVDLFLRVLRGPDRFAVAAFDDRVAVLADWRPMRGSRQSIRIRPSDQKTEFYGAVDWATQEMRGVRGRKGVVIFTGGRDREMYPKVNRRSETLIDPNYSVPVSAEGRFQQTLQTAQQARMPLYFVAVDTDQQLPETSAAASVEGWMRFLAGARHQMEQLADATGGRVFFPKDVEDVLPL